MKDELTKLQAGYEFRKVRRRQPDALAAILTELISRRGLGRLRGQGNLEEAWQKAIGEPGARYTRVGAFRRGVLEILVDNSVLLQELAGFQKQQLLVRMRELLQSDQVRDLRFRLDANG